MSKMNVSVEVVEVPNKENTRTYKNVRIVFPDGSVLPVISKYFGFVERVENHILMSELYELKKGK